SVVERCPDKTEVLGSIPSRRTWYIWYGANKTDVEGRSELRVLKNKIPRQLAARYFIYGLLAIVARE
ncbi:MAG: hypothetical protein Q7S47_00875, partial [bacterium]|nr:hypothetical protein [bacterium]